MNTIEEETIDRAFEVRDMTPMEMRLRWGEMSAQEIRTVKAVLNYIIDSIELLAEAVKHHYHYEENDEENQ
jgi:hypothetical protein